MRFATWNVNSVGARLPRLEQWLDLAQPDVLCLQETKCAGDAFPSQGATERGYQVAAHGEGRWNGVAILSRVGLEQVTRGFTGEPLPPAPADSDPALIEVPGRPLPEARAMAATCGPLRVWSVYVPNGRTLDSPQFPYKLRWLAALRAAVEPDVRSDVPFVIAGDFNVAPADDDVWDPSVFVGSTHVTEEERRELAGLRALGLEDVRARALKHGTPYTYWDYRAGMFHKNQGMRIDLVYASRPAASAVTDAYVDRDARKGKGPSDHAPIVVDLDL
ncbi:exodeoxyribonuclease III [Actinopolymorpha singaporensis]|uniref:Exodeoxyribonuclease-3 n=1 Tax=Actinopolymorpha singaporensis TaxID=117157 RepID=A0A1H1P3U7_9ACTN|nr:exodeoxyribonuclease III [Actinopolymorpha singaporensis]SDS05710.1 exodeoxyribonuclease-3 [Actinopolymorpha singaporensis]